MGREVVGIEQGSRLRRGLSTAGRPTTYYPWVISIERLWEAMHDTVTRNHRCRSMYELCQTACLVLNGNCGKRSSRGGT